MIDLTKIERLANEFPISSPVHQSMLDLVAEVRRLQGLITTIRSAAEDIIQALPDAALEPPPDPK